MADGQDLARARCHTAPILLIPKILGILLLTIPAFGITLLAAACGPSDAELDARIERAVATAIADAATTDLSAVYQQAWSSVFYIEPEDGQHGTGWLLEPGVIVTAAHVVSGSERVTVRQAAAPAFSATVSGMDQRRDVALLRYDVASTQLGAGAAPLALGDADIHDIARELLALGYSGSGVKGDGQVGSPKANAGILSQITNFGAQSYGRNLEMDAPIDPGDSGGPVLNTPAKWWAWCARRRGARLEAAGWWAPSTRCTRTR